MANKPRSRRTRSSKSQSSNSYQFISSSDKQKDSSLSPIEFVVGSVVLITATLALVSLFKFITSDLGTVFSLIYTGLDLLSVVTGPLAVIALAIIIIYWTIKF